MDFNYERIGNQMEEIEVLKENSNLIEVLNLFHLEKEENRGIKEEIQD